MTFLQEEEEEEENGAPDAQNADAPAANIASSINDRCPADDNRRGGTTRSTLLLLQHMRSNWRSLLLGQALSVLLATAGATQATLHLNCHLSAPTFSVGLVYLSLSLHLLVLRCRCRGKAAATATGINGDGGPDSYDDDIDDDGGDDNGYGGAIVLGVVSPVPTHTFLFLPLHASPWAYCIMALLDVQANYLTVLAYRYTTLTSISLFDALAIPSAMVLSRALLGRRYGGLHLLGVAICMAGVVVNVLQDYESDASDEKGNRSSDIDSGEEEAYPHKIRGDILAIIGGVLYGVNDTICEVCVRTIGDTVEFLGMIGFFAGIISIIQAFILEREDILMFFQCQGQGQYGDDGEGSNESTCSAGMGFGLLSAFVLVQIISYTGAARFLLLSEAAFFNLSLLTGDLWTVVFSITAERIVPQPLFFVALTLIVGGVCTYEMASSPAVAGKDNRDGRTTTRWSAVDPVDALELSTQDLTHHLT